MVESLSRHLSDQFDAGYMLVQARVEEIGYLHVPEWQWVLGLSATDSNVVRWVSDDYFVYCNPISNFVFTDAQLEILRGRLGNGGHGSPQDNASPNDGGD